MSWQQTAFCQPPGAAGRPAGLTGAGLVLSNVDVDYYVDMGGRAYGQLSGAALNLQSEQAERYVTASKLAHRFCRMLEETFIQHGYVEQLMRALRSFYRKTQVERLQLIGALG